MPKMKRHKGLAKRIKVSAKGKVRYNSSGAGHLMSGKSASRRRRMRKHVVLDNPLLAARIKRKVLN
ncbi:MAG: 50S ribosomal protein L35 [Phycisphaerae bacterium]